MEELSGNISHAGIKSLVIELDCLEALRHGQEEEKSSFRMGPPYSFRHVLSQQVQKMVTLVLIKGNALFEIGIKPAA